MITIKDLAKATGLSVTTVSRALNGYSDVNEDTRKKIKKAAEELNYRPSAAARSLVMKKSRTIGVIISDINREGIKDALAYEILCGINDRSTMLDYDILLFSTSSKKQQKKSYSDLCKERGVDGAVIFGLRVNDPYLEEIICKADFPCVLIDIPVESKNAGHVTTDNVYGAMLAVNHLLKLGHRKIAMINGHNEAAVSIKRLEGYKQALEQAGIPFDTDLVFDGGFSEEGGCEAMYRILLNHPDVTAVFSASDLMVLGALRAMEKLNRRVPQTLSIVGYDDIPVAAYCSPKLTTVRQDKYEMGYRSAQLVIDMIENRQVDRRIILQNELIIRESTKAIP
ncbi:LacI family DNA-binding transcriptional regulator [Paenibacillus montanisoli]|uniref:LacI family transcriptional regulator n=1 Tax=Paenibacillus montanisoli TaxID=2081970 RepID=A0A328U302_9BACL|nr:LacI family DNA-binding transcriptional regulator [Paenibacillus montanisoli]RAP75265.1 LacI family transcriptional regulator [Paenibacillus montanisoli]